MRSSGPALRHSRLARLARGSASHLRTADAPCERCDLCAQQVHAEHRHLLDLEARRLLCACQACTILFDRREAGGRHYRLVPDRCRYVEDFSLPDTLWARLAIPVELAFMFHNSLTGRVVAFYPSPAGATESLLELTTWDDIAAANPVLDTMEPDVEALLVNRAHEASDHWLVPVDDCYRLVGLIRTRWRGLSGGEEVWSEIRDFFQTLRLRSTTVDRAGHAVTVQHPHMLEPTGSPGHV
jgi:hypothetical protein